MEAIEAVDRPAQLISPSRALFLAIRPHTLMAGIGPVLIGVSLGLSRQIQLGGSLSATVAPSLLALLLVILLQAAANLVNDAKDSEKGVDHGERLGPMRVVQSGLLSLTTIRYAYRCLFAAAALVVAILFAMRPELPIPLVAMLCGLAAYFYTGGPYPLAYFALGELLACGFFGPIAVMGSSYLVSGSIDASAAFWGLGSGLIAAAIMAINNLRDRTGDRLAGKHTLATIFGEPWARHLPFYFLLLSTLLLSSYGIEHRKIVIAVPWTLLALMFIRRRIRPLLMGEAQVLNQALKFTALYNLFYAMLFASMILL